MSLERKDIVTRIDKVRAEVTGRGGYCRFGNVRENLIFANICEFVASQVQSSLY